MRASSRWDRLVTARLAEMDRLSPGAGALGPGYWNSRARRFAKYVEGSAERDPLFRRLCRAAGRRSSVLDVGAGPGRFSLALAPRVSEVVAVDSSPVMLRILQRRARTLGLANIRTVPGRWEDVDVPPADVLVCSYVLPLVTRVRPFLQKLDQSSRQRAFLYLNGASADFLFDPFWRHFHDRPRRPGPTYLDAVAVLAELGIRADVEVVEVPVRSRYPNVHAAAKAYRDQLLLPDVPEVRRELRALLSSWLVHDGGQLRPPVRTTPAAIVSWSPGRN